LLERLQAYLAPIQEKRRYYLAHLEEVSGIIAEGTGRAREVARHTMVEVREAMGL